MLVSEVAGEHNPRFEVIVLRHRRAFVVLLAVLVVGLVASAPASRAQSAAEFLVKPVLQDTRPDGVTIVWETTAPAAGRVECSAVAMARTALSGPLAVTEDTPVTIHKVRLTGLQPDTAYWYRVLCPGGTEEGVFRTAPASMRPVRFAALGDTRFWETHWQDNGFPEHMLARAPEFILHTGDIVRSGHDKSLWPGHFARFAASSGSIAMFPARGNHEGGPSPAETDWFSQYFDLPSPEPFYSFDWGNVHIAVVSIYAMDRCAQWLDQDLAATDRPWKFFATHVPVYCVGYKSGSDSRKALGMPEIEAVLDKHNVDMAIFGHTHVFERCWGIRGGKRDDRNGTVYYITAGGMGDNHWPEWFTAAQVIDHDYPHYAVIDAQDNYLDVRSYALRLGTIDTGNPVIEEIDHYIRWRDEGLPKAAMAKLESSDRSERLAAIEALGAMIYQPAARRLLPFLDSQDEEERLAAALALERIADEGVASELLAQLPAQGVEVQRHLARSLEAAMPDALARALVPLVMDPNLDTLVRVRLLGGLLMRAPEMARTASLKLLASPETLVVERAADVIKRTALPEDVPALLDAYRKNVDSEYISVSLAWGLNRLTGATVELGALEDATPEQRLEAVSEWQ